jgi:hypothetical protein
MSRQTRAVVPADDGARREIAAGPTKTPGDPTGDPFVHRSPHPSRPFTVFSIGFLLDRLPLAIVLLGYAGDAADHGRSARCSEMI